MNKISLFPEGNFYKASLHVHTTISDGKLTPELVKQAYKEKGYSVVAFTDHEVLVPHNDLSDESFIAITSYEVGINEVAGRLLPFEKSYHFNCFSKDKNKDASPVFNVNNLWLEHSKAFISENQLKVNYPLNYDKETINDVIKRLSDDGFLVAYNHPVWSCHDYEDYGFMRGLWGIEVYNGSAVKGFVDTTRPFDELLKMNKNVYPVAGDDMHDLNSAFHGFTMLKMPSLTYENVIRAMENGDFYASEGPEIYSLDLEGYTLKVTCSPCSSVTFTTQMRVCGCVMGKRLTSAEFDLEKCFELYRQALEMKGQETYFRVTVTDDSGKRAYTKAFFIKDLLQYITE